MLTYEVPNGGFRLSAGPIGPSAKPKSVEVGLPNGGFRLSAGPVGPRAKPKSVEVGQPPL